MEEKKVYTMDLKRYVDEMRKKGLYQEKKHDYAVMCPICYERHRKRGETNYRKLHLWVDKSYQYSHCFRDGSVFLNDDDSIKKNIDRLESPIDMNNWSIVPLGEEGYWKLSQFNNFDVDDPIGIDYLAHRIYLYRQYYKLLNIRFYKHNPVVPFYINGQLVYYQIRIINPVDGKKYHSPSISHKPPYMIQHPGSNDKKFVISEGVFDAIADSILYKDRTPFAVLGSDITDYQIAILRSFVPEDIVIYMDETSISYKIKEKLERYINYANITVRKSSGQDPEEYLKQTFIDNY